MGVVIEQSISNVISKKLIFKIINIIEFILEKLLQFISINLISELVPQNSFGSPLQILWQYGESIFSTNFLSLGNVVL